MIADTAIRIPATATRPVAPNGTATILAAAIAREEEDFEDDIEEEDEEEDEEGFFMLDLEIPSLLPSPSSASSVKAAQAASRSSIPAATVVTSAAMQTRKQRRQVAKDRRKAPTDTPAIGASNDVAGPQGTDSGEHQSHHQQQEAHGQHICGMDGASRSNATHPTSPGLSHSLPALSTSLSTPPPFTLLQQPSSQHYHLIPEPDTFGNVEYKYILRPSSAQRLGKLVTQLKWRLLEGGGYAVYELGVLDDGAVLGTEAREMQGSLEVLSEMAKELGAEVVVRRCIVVRANADKLPLVMPLRDEQARALLLQRDGDAKDGLSSSSLLLFQTTLRLPKLFVSIDDEEEQAARQSSASPPVAAQPSTSSSQVPAISLGPTLAPEEPSAAGSLPRRVSNPANQSPFQGGNGGGASSPKLGHHDTSLQLRVTAAKNSSAAANSATAPASTIDESIGSLYDVSSASSSSASSSSSALGHSSSSLSSSSSTEASQPTTPREYTCDEEEEEEMQRSVASLAWDDAWELRAMDVEGVVRYELPPPVTVQESTMPIFKKKRKWKKKAAEGMDLQPLGSEQDQASPAIQPPVPSSPPPPTRIVAIPLAKSISRNEMSRKTIKKRGAAVQRRERRRLEMRRKEREGMGIFDTEHPDFIRLDPVFSRAIVAECRNNGSGVVVEAAQHATTNEAQRYLHAQDEQREDEDDEEEDDVFCLSFEDEPRSFMATGPLSDRRRNSRVSRKQGSSSRLLLEAADHAQIQAATTAADAANWRPDRSNCRVVVQAIVVQGIDVASLEYTLAD